MKLNYSSAASSSSSSYFLNGNVKGQLTKKAWNCIAPLMVVMLFLFIDNQTFSQIIVESGTLSAGFGVDADAQTDGTWRIYDANGDLQPANTGSSDDWFDNKPLFGGNGMGVIDDSFSPPVGNTEWDPRAGMSQQPLYVDPNTGARWLDAVFLRDTH
jgi:hypothetical protein